MKNRSKICLLGAAAGMLLLVGCTPSYMTPHGGQSLPLVNPSFMATPVQSWNCDAANVGYCQGSK